MIALNPVTQEQKHPAAHETRSAPHPFCEKEQKESGKDQGNANAVQQFVPAGRVFVIVLRHVVRQTQSAPPVGGQFPRKTHFIPNCGKWLGARLQVAAAFHGFEHGDLIGILEVRTNGNADTDAGDPHAQRL